MKSASSETRVGVFRWCYPLFVRVTCAACEKRFRHEMGWVFDKKWPINARGTPKYLCRTCAPDREIAKELAEKHCQLPPRPDPLSAQFSWPFVPVNKCRDCGIPIAQPFHLCGLCHTQELERRAKEGVQPYGAV